MKKSGVTIFLLFSVIHLSAQQTEADSLAAKFDRHRKNNITEKIYVTTDRNFYLTGEILWFSVFATDGSLNKPMDLSKVVYVELVDGNNTGVLQGKIALTNGRGGGSFFLPASIASANYELRAYTNWMKNSGSDFFFKKSICIVNPFVKTEQPVQSESKIFADFFPEGGHLVAGLQSKIAFRITDFSGKGITASGAVVNVAGDTLVKFKSNKLGLGSFQLTPTLLNALRIVIRDSQKRTTIHNLPEIKQSGYILAVRDSGNTVVVEVAHNYAERKRLMLFVHARQIIGQTITGDAGQRHIFFLDRSKLSDGINHITLFDENLEPVAERLWFIYPNKKLSISIDTDRKQFHRRQQVGATIRTQPDQKTSVSISVFKLDSLSLIDSADIHTYLWLESDLKGEIESPASYFTDPARKSNAIDLLMLTHGWRRFKWSEVFVPEKILFIPEYRSHIIEGQVTNQSGEPLPNVMTWLSSPNKIVRLYNAVSRDNGVVRYLTDDFYGPRKVIAKSADYTIRVEIRDPYFQAENPPELQPLILDAATKNSLTERSVAMQVQDVFREEDRESFITSNIDSTAFYGVADETFLLDNYTRFPVMEEVMREYVPGVLVRKHRDGFHFIVLDDVNNDEMKEQPMILIDNIPLFDEDEIMSFDPRKIRKLEVMRRPYYLGTTLLHGIVSYTTYQGDLSVYSLKEGEALIHYDGLQLQREFYNPRYNDSTERASRLPDRRNLLFWSPQQITDESGYIHFDFSTSDLAGKFLIRVEGITDSGYSGSATQTVEVN